MAKKGKSTAEKVGVWSFIIGGLIALVLGAIPATAGTTWLVGLLLILGVIVGLLNISDKEIIPFLIACIAFLIAAPAFGGAVGGVVAGFGWLVRILSHISIFVLPAAVIASIKALFALAYSR